MFGKAKSAGLEFPVEFTESDRKIIASVMDHDLSMVGRQRLFATLMACRYVCEAEIEGDFVECGVWRGGNAMIAADVFNRHPKDAQVYLFDTFAGMTAPSEHDFDNRRGIMASVGYEKQKRVMASKVSAAVSRVFRPRTRLPATLDFVREAFRTVGVGLQRVAFIKGDVLKTLEEPGNVPDRISVLRLDTDWYESTKRELEVLWPRLSPGGVLMIDDYGHWAGAKKAVDEYFAGQRPFFQYIDHTGRMAVKER